jgi:hypothetical protein
MDSLFISKLIGDGLILSGIFVEGLRKSISIRVRYKGGG